MAESNMIPHCFAKLNKRFKTPIYALLLIGILSVAAPFFGRTMLVWIADSASFACCTAYCIVSMSFLMLRKKDPDMDRPFKIKHYRIVGIVASVMSGMMVVLYLIPNSGCEMTKEEWGITGGWIVLGLIFFIWSKVRYKDKFAVMDLEKEKV